MLMLGLTMSIGLYAQQEKRTNEHAHKHEKAKVAHGFGCPVCLWNSEQPGKCIHHNVDLVPDGWYYCKTDVDVMSSKSGKCHRCGSTMERMQTGTISPQAPEVATNDTTNNNIMIVAGKGERQGDRSKKAKQANSTAKK